MEGDEKGEVGWGEGLSREGTEAAVRVADGACGSASGATIAARADRRHLVRLLLARFGAALDAVMAAARNM